MVSPRLRPYTPNLKLRTTPSLTTISLGTYSEISLRDARVLHDVARALVARGIGPRVHWQLERNAGREASEKDQAGLTASNS
ncbi:Arm DNA-binding domain-containing protein [Pseudomonas lini]|uniref:Arm DNA-binding domain-containing protein n=1 Tax=Pseudomonas lini TaxID=163011 RepID=UPI00345F0E74